MKKESSIKGRREFEHLRLLSDSKVESQLNSFLVFEWQYLTF